MFAIASIPASAADFEIMAPAAPGGGYDRTARAFEQALEKEKLGAANVINVGGAGGAIGLAQFIRNRSGSDNAMIVGGFGMVASFATNKSKVTLADVTPVARLTSEYSVVVVPKDSPIKSIADLVAKLKQSPSGVVLGRRLRRRDRPHPGRLHRQGSRRRSEAGQLCCVLGRRRRARGNHRGAGHGRDWRLQ